MNNGTDGHGPIESLWSETLRVIGLELDRHFNPGLSGRNRIWGFFLVVFPFEGTDGRFSYISSAKRAVIVKLLREMAEKFERDLERGAVQ